MKHQAPGGPDRPVFLVVETQVRSICFRALAQENISIIDGGFRERLGSKSVKLLFPMGSQKHDWVFILIDLCHVQPQTSLQ